MNMRFYVNIDHVATIREARKTDEPDPVRAAVLVELAGAHGITVHLREDRRHIQDRDLRLLLETARTGVNLELAADERIVAMACELLPMQATLVPEKREEVTTEGGLDLTSDSVRRSVSASLTSLRDAEIRTSLFIDPEERALEAARQLGADAVELHTGEYANARGEDRARQVVRLADAALRGRQLGLAVHAGHGLTYENVSPVAAIPEVEELNIGHSIVSRAVFVGLEQAVREMGRLIRRAPEAVGDVRSWVPP